MPTQDKLRQSVACIHGRGRGTGFFIGNDGTLLTCFHVVGDPETGQLVGKPLKVTFGAMKYGAECIFVSPDPKSLDVAVLRLSDDKLPDRTLPPEATLLPLCEWDPDPSQGREFRTFGFRSSGRFKGLYAQGEIEDTVSTTTGVELLQLTETTTAKHILPGMSGAPVFAEATEQVAGMVVLRTEDIPFAVPIEEIAKLWPPIKGRLQEEKVLKQLLKVLRPGQWFTEAIFEFFYNSLPFPELARYDTLEEDRPQALLAQVRNHGRVYDFLNCLRIKRPDIPLAGLIELPPVHRIHFVNREEELREACGRFALPYMLFEAPAGYGKTELLKAVEQRHFRDGWLCIYVETPRDVQTAIELANAVAKTAGRSDPFAQLDPDQVGYRLAGSLDERLASLRASGIILMVDSAERLPQSEIEAFLNRFLVALLNGLPKVDLRMRFAGRHIGPLWKKRAREFELTVRSLTPFRFRYVKATVEVLLPAQTEPDSYAAHLMHMTGGHPGCMAEIMERMGLVQSVEEAFEKNQDCLKEIVLPVAREVRESIPPELQDAFDVLSVFRRYNFRLLEEIVKAGIMDYKGDADSLEKALMATYLVTRDQGFIQDEIVRRLLAIRLRWEKRERFIELCKKARLIYEQDLQTTTYQPAFIALEGLFQELRLGYYQGAQDLAARQVLRDAFFIAPKKHTILRRYLDALAAKPYTRDVKARFKEFFDKDSEWEFRFAVNFFLRGEQYNDEPYEKMVKQVKAYFP